MAKRVAQAGGTTEELASYFGIAKQLVVNTETFRVHVMDGKTAGGIPLARISDLQNIDLQSYLTIDEANATFLGKKEKAASAILADRAATDANGNEFVSTYATKDALTKGLAEKQPVGSYLTVSNASTTYLSKTDASNSYLLKTDASSTYLPKTEASELYLGKTAKAQSAIEADSAVKATKDGSGNSIVDTYATKEFTLETFLGKTDKASSAVLSDKAIQDSLGNIIITTYATKDEVANTVTKIGNRGIIAGYETLVSKSTETEVTSDTNDSLLVTEAVNILVKDGAPDTSYTKTIGITNASATIQLYPKQKWVSGIAPTVVANSVLICCQYGTFGLATYVTGGIEPTDGTGNTTTNNNSGTTA